MSQQSCIYAIRNSANGKVYIGSAVVLQNRWQKHRYHLKRGTHHSRPLQRAWLKHGASAFVFEVLEVVPAGDLIRVEQAHLDRLRPFGKRGYNGCRIAGSVLGIKFSAASRSKLIAARATPEYRAQQSAINKGRRHTAETRAKVSAVQVGRKASPETRAKMSAARIGRKILPNARAALLASNRARTITPAHREKLVAAIRTPEARAKNSAARKGVPLSPEHRANVAAALRTPEARAKNAAARLGQKSTLESRAKASAALKGRKKTPEHLAAIAAARARRADT